MKSRYLFSYCPQNLDQDTKFFWVFLSESRKDRQLREHLAGISRQCPDFLFVKYDAHWRSFILRLMEQFHPTFLASSSHSIIKMVSPTYIRRLVDDIVSANPSNVKNLSQLLSV